MKQQEINELHIDELIWGIFIFLSILNIYGDELEIDYIISNKFNSKTKAKKIFTLTVFISLIIYIYIAIRNYKNIESNEYNSYLGKIRFSGSVFIVIGVGLLLYFQLNSNSSNNSSVV